MKRINKIKRVASKCKKQTWFVKIKTRNGKKARKKETNKLNYL